MLLQIFWYFFERFFDRFSCRFFEIFFDRFFESSNKKGAKHKFNNFKIWNSNGKIPNFYSDVELIILFSKGRLNELLSQVRLQTQVNGLSGGDHNKLDQFAKEDIKALLKQQHEGIQSLVQAMKQDLSALEIMNEKLSKGKTAVNK